MVENALELYPEVVKARSRQYEFARLNLTYTILGKQAAPPGGGGYVQGWDDPRMPTVAAFRRRGVTPEAIRDFCDRIGVARADSTVDLSLLEHCIREDLNHTAQRVMAVLEPLKVVITNWPEDHVEWLDLENLPGQEEAGTHKAPFAREIYIEQEDFMEDPPRKFHRLAPGREVRLKGAYIIQCQEVIKDAAGKVVELRCTYDPQSRSGEDRSGKKVKGVIHWVSAQHGLPATVRLYDNLFLKEDPEEGGEDFTANINPNSLVVLEDCIVEPAVAEWDPDTRFQFLRKGYFYLDPQDSSKENLVFNRIVGLRDSWAKINK